MNKIAFVSICDLIRRAVLKNKGSANWPKMEQFIVQIPNWKEVITLRAKKVGEFVKNRHKQISHPPPYKAGWAGA